MTIFRERSMMLRLGILIIAGMLASSAFADQAEDLVAAARAQIGVTVHYDPSYQRLAYPGGDVPLDRGVCTDVVIRAYRRIGIDLQERVHKDMRLAWRVSTSRKMGVEIYRYEHRPPTCSEPGHVFPTAWHFDSPDWRACGVPSWRHSRLAASRWLTSIGIVSDRMSPTGRPFVIHNIASGVKMDDVLFAFTITGHYRYLPSTAGKQ